MLKPIVAFFKNFSARSATSGEMDATEPDQSRRMVILGGAALVAGTLLVPALSTPAEAHSRRRRRRRRRRHRHYHRHGHRHYGRRRRRYYGYGHRHYGYYYHRPYYRHHGIQLYFGF
ncbi:MAG: hypothetical protein OER56_04245 [Hyphomicrobiales bacterium]|nr:hypothetical protein [Hyphomicrobiales bacterium]